MKTVNVDNFAQFDEARKSSPTMRLDAHAHCLKITQNVAFEFLNFGIFHQFLSY